MLRSPESSISIKLMNSDTCIQPNTSDCGVYAIAFAVSLAFGKEPAYLNFDNSKMRSHLLNCLQSGVLTEFPCKPEQRKSVCTGTHCAAILHLPNARERPDVPVYQMSALVSSQLPRNQNDCATIEKFKDCKMSRMQIKVIEVNAMARFREHVSIYFQNFIKCYFYLSNNCLCFIFPLIYRHHGAFTDLRTNSNYGQFTDLRQLRTFTGLSWTYGNYGTVRELS